MPHGPLVSVVIPTYNLAGMLVEAIESVLAQTYRDHEIIVVDDGSTDDTAARVEPYLAQGVVHYVFQQNQRQAAARNRGIAMARGDLFAFLDHDDLWSPEKLERQVPLFDDATVGIVYCGAREVDPSGATLWEKGTERFCRGAIFDRLLFDHFITCSSVVVRRSCLDRVGVFQEDLYGVDDIHLWLRICHDWAADFVPDVLVSCRSHDANMKKDPDLIPRQRFRALADIFRRYRLDVTARGEWRHLHAEYHFCEGYRNRKANRRLAMASYSRSLAYEPRWRQLSAMIKLLIPGGEAWRALAERRREDGQ